jgi:hypothetical protein
MKILAAKVNWLYHYCNFPCLEVLVDQIPQNFEYEQKGNLYFAESEGFCIGYYYSEPGEGFGGRVFPLKMVNGSVKELTGPWSCESSSFNKHFKKSVDISITDSEINYNRGYTFRTGKITLEKAIEAADLAKTFLVKIVGEEIYAPSVSSTRLEKPLHEETGGFVSKKAELITEI